MIPAATVLHRGLACAVLAVAVAGCATIPAAPTDPGPPRLREKPLERPLTPHKLSAERHEAARKIRRIIFNNDGNEPVYLLDEPTTGALLAARTTGLLGTHVDSIFYCTWSTGFGYFTHDTKVGALFTRTENRLENNRTAELIARGIDPLSVMIEFSRANALEIFWSLRMNDAHDAHDTWYGPLLMSPLKRDNPHWMVGSHRDRPVNGRWTTVDYALDEVRDTAFAFVEEIVTRYDVDGIQLDFFRDPALFASTARGHPASLDEIELMTGWMSRVRTLTETIGEARGRPLLIAVRVPDSLDYAWKLGMDVENWLAQDLVDLLVVGGYFRLEPWENSVALGQRYDVPVYADLSDSRQRDPEARSVYASLAALRGRAMTAWQAGVDGLHLFNMFDPTSVYWRELGDPVRLRDLDKVYVTSARGFDSVRLWWRDGEQYMLRDVISPDRPRRLERWTTTLVTMPVGEATTDATTTLKVRVADIDDEATIDVAVNDVPAATLRGTGRWRTATLPPGLVVAGHNRFELTLDGEAGRHGRIEDFQLAVCRSCGAGP